MKIGKILIIIASWVVVLGLGYKLYDIIQEPVQFEKDYNARFDATTARMQDIKTAQGFYYKANGKYAGSLDSLIASLKNDLITEVVINGNEDDTSVVTTYDTLKYYATERIELQGTVNIDDLKFIPFSDGETFDLQADMLTLQRVEVPVYEVSAPKTKYLKNMKEEYTERKHDLILGSITMASEKANWE